jgi:cbb3-type cytochrome oxidase cytochrome c subunit/cytochrome c553
MPVNPEPLRDGSDLATAEEIEQHLPGLAWLRTAYGVMAIAGVGFFLLSFLLLAVWPNQVLEDVIASTRPSVATTRTVAEEKGRHIYIREGCGNCHSQLIRFSEADVRRFGVASQAWESDQDFPQLWGTRRIGPDLSREHGRRSQDWHLAHLYAPEVIVPDSVMPAHRWLFAGSITQPTQEALDLVAYLDSMGRDAQLAGRTGPQPLAGINSEEEKRRGMFCDCSIPRTTITAPGLNLVGLEPSEQARLAQRGRELFTHNCAGCHGSQGKGDGVAAEALLPRPRNLTQVWYSDRALSRILWTGRPGSSMPAWNDLTLGELRALASYTQSLADKNATERRGELKPEEVTEAQGLYSQNCQNCHGVSTGPGTAPTALAPAATLFHQVRPSLEDAEKVLAEGVAGSAMTPWNTKLSEAQRRLLARYIRTLYREEP